MRPLGRFAKGTVLAYLAAGMVYSVTGYLHRAIVGKQTVFSPLIGIPMDVAGWPWMVYADLKHVGAKAQDVLTLIALVAFVAVFVRKELLSRRSVS